MGIGNHVLGLHILGRPLPSAGWALGEFPVVGEHHLEIALIPAGGVRFPGAFDATGDGVFTFARFVAVSPSQALLMESSTFWFGVQVAVWSCTVALAERVSSSHQGHRFLHGHAHAGKGFTHVAT